MKIKPVSGIWGTRKKFNDRELEMQMEEISSALKDVNFSFRDGFTDRLMYKLNRIMELDPMELYYKNLSTLLPKIAGFSFAALVLMGLILFALHGTLSPDKFLGADRIDENNFISYLILDR